MGYSRVLRARKAVYMVKELRSPKRRMLELARVLLVDDDPTSRLTLQTVLRAGGYHVDAAASAAEAVGKLDEAEYELVLTDLHMESPESGLKVLAHARLMEYKPATALITTYRDSGRPSRRPQADGPDRTGGSAGTAHQSCRLGQRTGNSASRTRLAPLRTDALARQLTEPAQASARGAVVRITYPLSEATTREVISSTSVGKSRFERQGHCRADKLRVGLRRRPLAERRRCSLSRWAASTRGFTVCSRSVASNGFLRLASA